MNLRLEHIYYERNRKPLLKDISTVIPGNSFTCLLGANGAGKTTLLSILTGELKAAKGKIFIGDAEASGLARREIAHYFAIIPQNAPTPQYLTVSELVELGLFEGRKGLWWRLNEMGRQRVGACIARCQLKLFANRKLEELSGGERQRAWLAFGLVSQKDFLILDETLEGMDIFVKRSFFKLLKDVAAEGNGILLTSHDMSMVNEYADRVIILKDGLVSYDGLPQDNLQEFLSPNG